MLAPELFPQHPEYFALNADGSRAPGERTNWCISSAGMRDLLRENAAALARKHGIENFSTFAVGMNGAYLEKFGEERLLDYAEILNRML